MRTVSSSRIQGFHQLSVADRRAKLQDLLAVSDDTADALAQMGALDAETADHMIENVVGAIGIPIGVATNLIVDGQEVLMPMATEESSVVAAVCNAAKMNRGGGGIQTSSTGPMMIGQIQLVNVSDPHHARLKILSQFEAIQALCDDTDPILKRLGGGLRDIEVRVLETAGGTMVVTHLLVDTRDAMGANAVNSMAERVAPQIEAWTGGKVFLRILSNLADRRLVRARGVWRAEDIGGEAVRDGMISAFQFADADPYRATTHNKGIMNGVSAVVLATGNDTRAIEAGAHAFAARTGRYRSLTTWEVDRDGNLVGMLEMPMAVGLIGGATKVHPTARAVLDLMKVDSADELARLIAAVGLAQNFAAMRVLATTGVQKGHMSLHAKNIAIMAGASGAEIEKIADVLRARGTVRQDVAEELLTRLRQGEAIA